MEPLEGNTIENQQDSHDGSHAGMVHFVLSHSYVMFFGAVVLGLIFDVFLPTKIFSGLAYSYTGIGMILLGSILIYWAQSTSETTRKQMEKQNSVRNFSDGPYRYSRNPTHIGLTIMTLGLAFVLNSFPMILFIFIASFIAKFIFLRKEEALLEKRYGEPYLQYKKKVSTWV